MHVKYGLFMEFNTLCYFWQILVGFSVNMCDSQSLEPTLCESDKNKLYVVYQSFQTYNKTT